MQKEQGYVALCARTPIRRESMIEECIDLGVYGIATDLFTLYKTRDTAGSPLWDQTWKLENNFTFTPARILMNGYPNHLFKPQYLGRFCSGYRPEMLSIEDIAPGHP